MWRSLHLRRLFHSSVRSASFSKVPSAYRVPTLFSPNDSSATSSSSVILKAEELGNMKGSMWWNLEDRSFPSGFSIDQVVDALHRALRVHDIECMAEIYFFGDVSQLSTDVRVDRPHTLTKFTHISKGGNNAVQSFLIFNLLNWVSQNPPPFHVFVISTVDSNLDKVLQHLKKNNYNVWLATVEGRDPETEEESDPETEEESDPETVEDWRFKLDYLREISRIMYRFRAY